MAKKRPDYEPEELEDFPEEAPSSASSRRAGLPDAAAKPDSEAVVGNLARTKKELPSFASQDRRQAKRLEDMDLEGEDSDSLREEIRPQTPKKSAPRPAKAEGARAGSSSRDIEEALRREGGRPKSDLRPSDFEPLAWASSDTRLHVPKEDENGKIPEPVSSKVCLEMAVGAVKKGWSRLSALEMASVSVFLVAALLGVLGFRSLVHSFPEPVDTTVTELAAVAFPLQGEGITVASLSAIWHIPQEGDIVRPGMEVVPELKLSASGRGYLRVLIRDEEGLIRGDPFAEEVGGQTQDFTVTCSEGYRNRTKLVERRAGRLAPWRVLVYESSVYDVPLEEWKLLAEFAMPSETE
jgi:hypothetical protein